MEAVAGSDTTYSKTDINGIVAFPMSQTRGVVHRSSPV